MARVEHCTGAATGVEIQVGDFDTGEVQTFAPPPCAWCGSTTGKHPIGCANWRPEPCGEPTAEFLEAVDHLLDTAPCDCSHKRRFEDGEHMSHCYLFDLNWQRNRMLKAEGNAGARVDSEAPSTTHPKP